MRTKARLLLGLSILGVATLAAAADGDNIIRFGGAYVAPTGDLTGEASFVEDLGDGTTLAFDGTLTLEPQSEAALFVGYERRLTDLLGVEFTLWGAEHDVDGQLKGTAWLLDSNTGELITTAPIDATEKLGTVTVNPVTAGVNFHLTPNARADLYLGPFVSYVLYGDLEAEGEQALAIDDDFGWGAVVGVDISLGKSAWLLTGAARYLDTEASPKDLGPDDDPLDVTPWVVQISAGVKF